MDAQKCPFCGRYAEVNGCSYVFACGLDEKNVFRIGQGCTRAFCFTCGKKYCSQQYDATTGQKASTYRDMHDANCCRLEADFKEEDYCCGGHNGHCPKRW